MRLHQDNRNSKKLIAFFPDWGMDVKPFQHLDPKGYDVWYFYDYCLDSDLKVFDFYQYAEVNLIGWSIGVWIADWLLLDMDLKYKICLAVNGTPCPVDDDKGMPVKTFEDTVKHFSYANHEKHMIRMLGGKAAYNYFTEQMPESSLKEIQRELNDLVIMWKDKKKTGLKWTHALICTGDTIFPFKTLEKYWMSTEASIIVKDLPHYPFYGFESWEELLQICK